jgi:hypothetical protein
VLGRAHIVMTQHGTSHVETKFPFQLQSPMVSQFFPLSEFTSVLDAARFRADFPTPQTVGKRDECLSRLLVKDSSWGRVFCDSRACGKTSSAEDFRRIAGFSA